MSKHPGLNKKPGSWQEKERKKTGAKQSSRPKLRENPGHNKAIRANVPNSHPGLLLRTLKYVGPNKQIHICRQDAFRRSA